VANDPEALARVTKALASGDQGGDASRATSLPDNFRVDGDCSVVPNPKGTDAMKTFGPYPHRGRWRVVTRQAGEQRVYSFSTEKEAQIEINRLRLAAARQVGISTEKAIAEYESILTTNGLRPRSVQTTGYRLRKLFQSVLPVPLATITPAKARELVTALAGSVDSRKNIVAEAKTFCTRAKERGWIDTQLLQDVRAEGKRRCGKTKLTVDESKKFLAACLQLAASSNPKKKTAGVGSAMALVFGLRASEITGLQVKNLDADGTIIRITTAKSRAGIRSLAVPTWFKPFLAELADGKQPGDLLVGHDRTWLHRSVRAICKQAGVTEAPPHGLRGTHGDLALVGAATPAAVSRALGHESQEVTFRHYADRGLADQQQHMQAMETLVPHPIN
jgi:integrase